MMTSSNGNIFCIIGPLWGEFAGDRWIPLTKASDAEFWCSLICTWTNGWANNRDTDDFRPIALIMTSLYCEVFRHCWYNGLLSVRRERETTIWTHGKYDNWDSDRMIIYIALVKNGGFYWSKYLWNHWLECCCHLVPGTNELTHWGRGKMATILQPTFSNSFCLWKLFYSDSNFTECFLTGFELSVTQHWFR